MPNLGKGYSLTKDGKIKKSQKSRSVSDIMREKKSKKQRVVSRAKAQVNIK